MERKTGNKTNIRILCAVLLLALCCLGIGFFRAGNLYPVDYGQYERIMTQCGLTWTEADLARGGLQYERPITTFEYTRFSWSALLTPQGGGALVYVTALCRLILQPLGLPLSLQAVGAVLALVLAAGTTMLAAAFRRLFPRGWFCPVLLLLEIYADGNFCVMLRSLYPEGAAIAFGILTTGLAFLAYSLPVPRRRRLLIPVTILASVVVTGIACLIPIRSATQIDPALVLKGE